MIDWQTLQEWQADWLSVDESAIRKRQGFLLDALSREQTHMTRAIKTLRDGRKRLVLEYADIFTDQLELDSSVSTTSNPHRLLALAEKPWADTKPNPQRWFEAISRFDQAVAVAKIEMEDSYETLDRDINRLMDFLWDELFEPVFEKIEVYCYHDPKIEYAVRAEDVGIGHHLSRPGLQRRKSNLTCRKTRKGELAFFRHRIKDSFDTWLKTQRQIHDPEKKDLYVVHDRCGLTFIVPTLVDLHNIALSIVELLLENGGIEIEPLDINDGKTQSVDVKNHQSSPKYKAAKTLIEWRGRVFEFQFLTFHDYFTSKQSLNDSNHDLYRLRQTMNFFLPLLWPKEIYDVDWVNPRVRSSLRKWKMNQLGWRVNVDHSTKS